MKLVSYDEEHITALPFEFNIAELQKALNDIKHLFVTGKTQISITHTSREYEGKNKWYEGCIPEFLQYDLLEEQFTEFNEELKDTYFYHIHNKLSDMYNLGRGRLMLMKHKVALTWHGDIEERVHVPIISNPGNKLAIMNKCYQLKEGMSYVVNTIMPHSAFNGGFDNRVTLVYHILGYKSNAVTNLSKPMYKLKNKDPLMAAKELESWVINAKITPASQAGVQTYAEYIGANKL